MRVVNRVFGIFAAMAITLRFFGAAGTVTGSKHLLRVDRADGTATSILLDCGMFQGESTQGPDGQNRNRHFGFRPADIDIVVLSHAHIDHSGLLPRLVAEGFKGTIWSTPATRELCAIMLEDSARIQEADAADDRRHAERDGRPPDQPGPLYTAADVPPALERFATLEYGFLQEIAPGVVLSFHDAGHILGSASVHLVVNDGTRELRLAFSGDVGRSVDRLLPQPTPLPPCDILICETTYGDRDHAAPGDAESNLLRQVQEVCVARKGRLLIPAFSIGKTQEVLYTLNHLANEGRLPRVPVFVDSPLAISATGIARRFSELFRPAVRAELLTDTDLFGFPGVTFTRTVEESKAINDHPGPCIIIAASGMMEAGRIRHHLLHALPHPANGVLAVGFCAPGTLGAELLAGARTVHLWGRVVPVRASVARMEFYSAHADRTELLRFVGSQHPGQLKRVFLVHGVDEAREAFRQQLEARGYPAVTLPRMGERFEL
jgi:metallo-beta-lactamase family protein